MIIVKLIEGFHFKKETIKNKKYTTVAKFYTLTTRASWRACTSTHKKNVFALNYTFFFIEKLVIFTPSKETKNSVLTFKNLSKVEVKQILVKIWRWFWGKVKLKFGQMIAIALSCSKAIHKRIAWKFDVINCPMPAVKSNAFNLKYHLQWIHTSNILTSRDFDSIQVKRDKAWQPHQSINPI